MEFRETLLAAQRNQQQKSSGSCYYKARFDPPKKEQKQRDKLSANIQKFLAKKEEEERQKKLEAQKKREELSALRDPKALRKIQKTLKVIKSANKSVLQDAVDHEHTAVTREGPDQPDQDDYGYESQESAAIYEKMMQKYSKMPEEPKFPTGSQSVKKDLNGTRERVKHALQHDDDPVPHKRRRRGGDKDTERDLSPPTRYEPEKKESKPDKPKFKKPAPPPMDFNQLLKLAEQKKSEPIEVAQKKEVAETTSAERLMTKKQKREYEEEMARRQRRQERIDAEKSGNRKVQKDERPEKERKPEPSGFGRIPKLSDKNSNTRNISPKPSERERIDKSHNRNTQPINRDSPKPSDRDRSDRERLEKQRERDRLKNDKDKIEVEKERIDRERLERLKAERERIDRDIERLNKDRDKLDKTKSKLESVRTDKSKIVDRGVDRSKISSKDNVNRSIDLKSQNTYRIDKNSNEKKLTVPSKNSDGRYNMNGQSSQGKPVSKLNKEQGLKNAVKERPSLAKDQRDGSPRVENGKKIPGLNKGLPPKRPDERRPPPGKSQAGAGPSKAVVSSFDFDKHVNALKKNGLDKRPADGKRRPHPDDSMKKKRRAVPSDSEYDSEMDDFIDDGDENMDYSTHIKEIFGYDKHKYRDMDDDDDPTMESSFARQQREEYISKKIGIMEDLEDMRLEAMEKKKSKKRRISDD